MIKAKILQVGCGKMGGALLGGLVEKTESKQDVIVISPNGGSEEFGVRSFKNISEIPENFEPDIILLAVKPQIMDKVLSDYQQYKNGKTLYISIAAGKTLGYFENKLGNKTPIVRAMPNIPAFYNVGATTLCANGNVDEIQKNTVKDIFSSVGEAIWLEDESMLDVATALAGSGPAYIFHLLECLVEESIKRGLSPQVAKTLAVETVLGSAIMAKKSDKTITELKNQVISPNGTTQAGIDALSENDSLSKLINNTIEAATNRSKELAS